MIYPCKYPAGRGRLSVTVYPMQQQVSEPLLQLNDSRSSTAHVSAGNLRLCLIKPFYPIMFAKKKHRRKILERLREVEESESIDLGMIR